MSDSNKIKRTNDEQKRAVEIYDAFRDELYKRQLSNSEAYDKAILSLSSAGLAISLSFIRFVVPIEQAIELIVLKASWILFLLSIIFTLISFLIGNKGISKQLENAEKYYVEGNEKAYNKFNIYKLLNSIFNYISGILFITALCCVVYFVISNIKNGDLSMSKGVKTVTNGTANDSAPIPTMQKVGSTTIERSAGIPSMQKVPVKTSSSQSKETADNNTSKK